MKLKSSNEGFTLIEVIIGVALLGLLVYGISSFTQKFITTNQEISAKENADVLSKLVLNRIENAFIKKTSAPNLAVNTSEGFQRMSFNYAGKHGLTSITIASACRAHPNGVTRNSSLVFGDTCLVCGANEQNFITITTNYPGGGVVRTYPNDKGTADAYAAVICFKETGSVITASAAVAYQGVGGKDYNDFAGAKNTLKVVLNEKSFSKSVINSIEFK